MVIVLGWWVTFQAARSSAASCALALADTTAAATAALHSAAPSAFKV